MAITDERRGSIDEDDRIAAEWGLTLHRLCSTTHGGVTGIYRGRAKVADYCHDTRQIVIGAFELKPVATLFDAIVSVGDQASAMSDRQRHA